MQKKVFRSLGPPQFQEKCSRSKRPFSELWERSGVFSEQLSEFRKWFSECEIPFWEWRLTTCATRKPQFSEQLPESFLELMGTHTEDFHFRKILVSVKFLSAILGPEMAAPILWAPGKNALFLQEKPMSIKFLLLGGRGVFWFWGGGNADFIFMGARTFLIICPCILGAFFQELGFPARQRLRLPDFAVTRWMLPAEFPPVRDRDSKDAEPRSRASIACTHLQCVSDGQGVASSSARRSFHNFGLPWILRSRPGKPNQRKGQNEKFMWISPIFLCEFWCFFLGKTSAIHISNFCSGMPPGKVHELAFLWFGLPGWLLTRILIFLSFVLRLPCFLCMFQTCLPLKCAFPPGTKYVLKTIFDGRGAVPGTVPLHILDTTSQQEPCHTTLTLQSLLFSFSSLFSFCGFPCFFVRFCSLFQGFQGFSREENLEKVQGATRIGATGLRASEREICLWEGLWEDLWKPLKNLWKPLKNLLKPLKTSQNLSKPLKTSQNL